MRVVRQIFAVFLLLTVIAAQAQQAFRQRAVRIVVPYPPGSGTDIATRILGQKLSEIWGQAVVVDNRPGAGAIIGVDAVAKAAPDGYTLGIADTGPLAINPAVYPQLPYDPVKDFAPVTEVATLPFMLVVNASLPVKSVGELIALAKSKPGEINYASVGNGSVVHLATELFNTRAGIDMKHIPYKGSAPALQGLLSGDVQVMFVNLFSALALVQSGKLRALAAASATRIGALPDLPTVAEAGVPGYEFMTWFGLIAPAGTPKPIVAKLNEDFRRVLAMPDVRETFRSKGGFEPVGSSIESFTQLIPAEIARWGKVVRDNGIKVD